LWGAALVLAVLALVGSTGALTDLWVSLLYRDIEPDKAAALQANLSNIQRGLWLSAVLAAALAGSWHLRTRGWFSSTAWVSIVVLLAILDPLRVDGQFIRVVDVRSIYARDEVTDFLLRQAREGAPFRVATVRAPYGVNQFAFFGLEEEAGHHGNELGRYRDLVEEAGLNARVLQLLNVRDLVSGVLLQSSEVQEVFRGRAAVVYELPWALPRAYVVSEFEVLPDSLALRRLLDPEFDLTRSAVLDQAPGELEPGATGRVAWRVRELDALALEVVASGPALLVVSDNWYPAWQATVDGMPVPVLRANYTLRAVRVPAGSHEVRFEYRSKLFRAAAGTSLISTLAVFTIVALGLRQTARRRRAGKPAGGESA
jgi:hypothetical protein